MGLPARQRRVLDRIESTLRGSDPRLAALYAVFARLTRDEEMPRIEQLRHRAVALTGRIRLRLAHFLARVFGRLIPRQRAVLFFPLALALAVVSIVFAAQSGTGKSCTPVTQVAAANTHHAPTTLCKYPNPYGTVYMGR
jgi:hypothetical protein